MAKVNISSYSGSVSAGDWSPAVVAAWNAIKATGGEIYFDSQTINMKSQATINYSVGATSQLLLRGDGSSEIQVKGTAGALRFAIGSTGRVHIEKITFTGDPAGAADCSSVIDLSFVLQAIIEGCIFAGIQCTDLIRVGTEASLKLSNCQLSGNSGNIVVADGARQIIIDNCEFLDYYALRADYHSKSPAGAAWFTADNPPTSTGAASASISVRNSRFDEAAGNAINIVDYPKVEIDHCQINANNSTSSAGIKLTGVKHAIIRQCHVGYAALAARAVELVNCENVVIIGMGVDGGVATVKKDGASNVKLLQSPNVTVETV